MTTGAVLREWGRRFALGDSVDLWFLALRAATLLAGILWRAFARDVATAPQLHLLLMFFVFSVGLYAVNALRPGHLPMLYRIALVFDLGIVFFLVRNHGGFASDLHLAFILLIALHAFYFGLVTGALTAAAAIVLYALAGTWPPPTPAFVLRVTFFALVGLCMGVLSEQARRQRDMVHQQHEQLLRSDRLATVGELAAGLAHELRNPLAGMAGVLHVLDGQLPGGDSRHELLAEVQAQIGRMNKTLSDLLQHVRPASPERRAVDLNALIDQSLLFLPRANVELVRRYEAVPRVEVDPHLLHQALLNMLVNARQAMPHGGRLTVETRTFGNPRVVEIVIADTGIGINPEHVERIFKPFFTTKTQGTGLGLAIAARIVEQHGGRITVDSTPGVGSTFRITLPAPAVTPLVRSEAYAT